MICCKEPAQEIASWQSCQTRRCGQTGIGSTVLVVGGVDGDAAHELIGTFYYDKVDLGDKILIDVVIL